MFQIGDKLILLVKHTGDDYELKRGYHVEVIAIEPNQKYTVKTRTGKIVHGVPERKLAKAFNW
jgi:hypothetical protein